MPVKSGVSKKARLLSRGVLHEQVPLAGLTTWKIGGHAEKFYIPNAESDFVALLQSNNLKEQVTILGLGSNVLVSSKGVPGITVLMTQTFDKVNWVDEETLLVEAGVSCAKIAKQSKSEAFSFFAGIPGTMGGALMMNAGAFGGETWDWVDKVEWVSETGVKKILHRCDFQPTYRHVLLPESGYFLRAYLKVPQRLEKVYQPIRDLLKKRSLAQPIGLPSCGSVFKNPPNHFAAQLIQECGLKGMKIGGAVVSLKHANFIVNSGGATSSDILDLMRMIVECVWLRFNVRLRPEVCLVGDFKDEEWKLLQHAA